MFCVCALLEIPEFRIELGRNEIAVEPLYNSQFRMLILLADLYTFVQCRL